jgi:hypothetical protein
VGAGKGVVRDKGGMSADIEGGVAVGVGEEASIVRRR